MLKWPVGSKPLEALLSRSSWTRENSRGARLHSLSVALQGGGSLGAFTWGVLDRLLEEKSIAFDAISGASAGAVNAVALAAGLASGGREGAREKLARLWQRFSQNTTALNPAASLLSAGPSWMSAITSMASLAWDVSARLMSPYQFNPLGLNPLRDILAQEIDFAALRDTPIRLLVAATRVKDGRARIFRNEEITLEAVLASTCLPHYHHAIEIDGEWYWDGGISANPPLLRMAAISKADDMLLVQLTPTVHHELPRQSAQIGKRLNQILFSLPLQHELDLLAIATELNRRQGIFSSAFGRKLQRLRLHRIAAEDEYDDFHNASGFNLDWSFLTTLRDSGRAAADTWLETSSFR